jgi:hypothetical protein
MSKAAELAKWGEVSTNGQVSGRRNIVINGAMNVAQRSASVADIGAANGYFTVDRIKLFQSGTDGRLTMSQAAITDLGGFSKAMKFDVTTADSSIAAGELFQIGTLFEGHDIQGFKKGHSDAEGFTVSFYVKGTAKTYSVELFDADNTRHVTQTFSVTTSWNRIVLNFPADTTGKFDSDNALSLYILIWVHAGSDYTSGTAATSWAGNVNANRAVGCGSLFSSTDNELFITGLQMEVGSVATPFEHRSFGEELQLCRRYLQYFDAHSNYDRFAIGTATTTDDCNFLFKFNPYMRDVPTLVHGTLSEIVVLDNDNSAEAIGSLSIDTNTDGPQGCNVEASDITSDVMTAGDATQIAANNTANAFISFDSEL